MEGYCFFVTMPDPIQPDQLRREFKNCSGNFLNIRLTARSWPVVTSFTLVLWKPPCLQMFRWWQRGWNRSTEVVETTVRRLLYCWFGSTGKALGQLYQCWWRIYREINVFPGSNVTCVTFHIHLWPIYWLSQTWTDRNENLYIYHIFWDCLNRVLHKSF
jgi:hypothetical protein